MRTIFFKSLAIAVVSALVTEFCVILYMRFVGIKVDINVWLPAGALPLLLSMPVSMRFFWQGQRLAKALDEFRFLHERLERAYSDLSATNKQLADKAHRDEMTGLFNREGFLANCEVRRADDVESALLVVDIDHFKRINDGWGHPVGDEALVAVADAIRASIRQDDIAGRIGGEEFAIFLPSTGIEAAGQLAERIRGAVAGIQFHPAQFVRMPLTVSVGGALCRSTDSFADTIRAADRHLYVAKRGGRNRVVVASDLPRAA